MALTGELLGSSRGEVGRVEGEVGELSVQEVVVVAEIAQGGHREVSVATQLVQDFVAELRQLGVFPMSSPRGWGGPNFVLNQSKDRVQASAK